MAVEHEDNDLPYRSPVQVETAKPVTDQDEDDFSTLLLIQQSINEAVANIRSVDVFELKEGELTVKEQIAGYRFALSMVEPLQVVINDTVNGIKNKQGGI